MNETLHFVEQHGYWLLAAAILGRQACFPVPANLFLLAAGALARSRKLEVTEAIAISIVTFLIADLAWYDAGRRHGDRILHLVCTISGDPALCIRRATSAFTAHPTRTLLTSKFVIGMDAVSAPLAGATGFSLALYVVLDAIGAGIWTSCYVAAGYLFSSQLDLIAGYLLQIGRFAAVLAGAAFGLYLLRRLLKWRQFLRQFHLARITPQQLRTRLEAGDPILLIDLHDGRDDRRAEGIPGAVRIDRRTLEESRNTGISPGQEVVLYCDSAEEFTAARVALALRRKGIERVHPLAGGLRAWRELGYPVAPTVPMAGATMTKATAK